VKLRGRDPSAWRVKIRRSLWSTKKRQRSAGAIKKYRRSIIEKKQKRREYSIIAGIRGALNSKDLLERKEQKGGGPHKTEKGGKEKSRQRLNRKG